MNSSVAAQDMSKPIVRRKMVNAKNSATMRTTVNCNEFGEIVFDEPTAHGGTGEGPSPLQGVLGALCGCASVTFNRTAKEKHFIYRRIDFSAEYTIDIRGRLGIRGVVPHFKTVRVDIEVKTDENLSFLEEVVNETEARCPVYNLLKDAQVSIICNWVKVEDNE